MMLLGAGVAACGTEGANDSANASAADNLTDEQLTVRVQAALAAAPAPAAATATNLRQIRPVLACVEKTGTNTYSAHFGYANSSASSITIPVGFFNRFWPAPFSGGQPTVFLPGTQPDVVHVSFNRTGAVAWILGLRFDIATSRSRACPIVAGTGGAGGGGAGGTGGQSVCPSNCDDRNPCTIDVCNASTGFKCSNVPARDGTICSDGDACTVSDSCTAGVCTPGLPVVCQALDQCHTPGVCNPVTGSCSMPIIADGTGCNDGNACTTGDACRAGICQGGAAVVCTAPDSCHSVGICDPATGICANPAVANGTTCGDNNACNGAETCQGGVCSAGAPLSCQSTNPCQIGSCDAVAGCVLTTVADGTSCFSLGACGPGTCQAGACATLARNCDDNNPCTVDSCGGNGACVHVPLADGSSCTDNNPCNGVETCQGGFCDSGIPVVCVPSDQCHTKGFCVPATGACTNPLAANGTKCDDGSGCTVGDTCSAGVCSSGPAKQCPGPSDQCHAAGTCNPVNGVCSNPALADFMPCNDGNGCTNGDVCRAGVCAPGVATSCAAADQCHAAGTCNPSSGVCSNPTRPEGSPCSDGDSCTLADACVAGSCQPGAFVTCAAPDQCHSASCDGTSGGCFSVAVADGTACNDGNPCPGTESCQAGICHCQTPPLQADVQNIVVIYAENRSFDGLFGNFPGAHGLGDVVDSAGNPLPSYIAQKDRDGSTILAKLPQTWGGATAAGNPNVVTQAQTDNFVNAPFGIENAFVASGGPALTTFDVTRDIAHRFFENIMEINGGSNDQFAAFEDAGGLTMGHWDNSQKGLYALAQQYVLADNFFEGAFGGSFLNHQYLICGCAPTVPSTYPTTNHASLNVLGAANAKGVPQLGTNATSPLSALTGPPSFKTGNIAPLDYFGIGDGYRAVNTMQPPYQPSGNFPATGAPDLRYADPAAATTLPPQTQTTIGDLLTARGIGWAWYATAYSAAASDGIQPTGSIHTVIYAPSTPRANPDFQAHHHPYNYYAAFDPATHAADRSTHLKDYNDMVSDIAAGSLPPVAWYKPTGNFNQHLGYANIDDGDAHIVDLVNQLKAGPQWGHMVIVITYDEYGGQWDHVAPPKGDLIGPGTRIPAIIISPYAKSGTVDHTQYDSASTLRLITKRFGLTPLPGLVARDAALVANGGAAMGDLTNALSLP